MWNGELITAAARNDLFVQLVTVAIRARQIKAAACQQPADYDTRNYRNKNLPAPSPHCPHTPEKAAN